MRRQHIPQIEEGGRRCSAPDCERLEEEHEPAPDRDALAAAIYATTANVARPSARAPMRWTDEMWRGHAYGQADRIIAAWYEPEPEERM